MPWRPPTTGVERRRAAVVAVFSRCRWSLNPDSRRRRPPGGRCLPCRRPPTGWHWPASLGACMRARPSATRLRALPAAQGKEDALATLCRGPRAWHRGGELPMRSHASAVAQMIPRRAESVGLAIVPVTVSGRPQIKPRAEHDGAHRDQDPGRRNGKVCVVQVVAP